MSPTRKKIIGESTAAAVALSTEGLRRSQTLTVRQYRSPPEDGRLQFYLTKIWGAVRQETIRRLSSTVDARNNGATAGGPKIFAQLQAGELKFFTLTGNSLNQAAPAPAADNHGSRQIAVRKDAEFGSTEETSSTSVMERTHDHL